MNIEELMVSEYYAYKKDNAKLREENGKLRWIIDNLHLKYQPEGKDIRAMYVLCGCKRELAEKYLAELEIAYDKRTETKVESQKATETAVMPKQKVEITIRDVAGIIKKRMNLTDEQLGKKVGVSQSNASGWIRGSFRPRGKNRQILLDLFETVKTEEEKNQTFVIY